MSVERQFKVQSEKLIIHPLYQTTTMSSYNVCLIQTKSISETAAAIGCLDCFSSVCLPERPPVHGRHCWIAGYGATQFNGNNPKRLHDVSVNIFDYPYCMKKSYDSLKMEIDEKVEFCAGVPDLDSDGLIDGGKDACVGDSGGPLVCIDSGHAVLYGLISWGIGCAQKGLPGVYANVFALHEWITQTVQSF